MKRKTITSRAHGADEDEVVCPVLLHCTTRAHRILNSVFLKVLFLKIWFTFHWLFYFTYQTWAVNRKRYSKGCEFQLLICKITWMIWFLTIIFLFRIVSTLTNIWRLHCFSFFFSFFNGQYVDPNFFSTVLKMLQFQTNIGNVSISKTTVEHFWSVVIKHVVCFP